MVGDRILSIQSYISPQNTVNMNGDLFVYDWDEWTEKIKKLAEISCKEELVFLWE